MSRFEIFLPLGEMDEHFSQFYIETGMSSFIGFLKILNSLLAVSGASPPIQLASLEG